MTALDNARALLSARCADLEKERLAHRKTRAELRRAKAKASSEEQAAKHHLGRSRSYLLAAGVVRTIGEAEAIAPGNAREQLRKLAAERDSLARDLDGARAEWRHHLERIASAIECEVSVKDEHGVLARKVAEAAKDLHERSLILFYEVERERGIVDALVRKGKESEET